MFEEENDFGHSEETESSVKRFEEMLRNQNQYFFDTDAFENIIDYYAEQGMFNKALQVVDYALNQHVLAASLLLKKAQLLIQFSRFEEAEEILQQVESLDPMAYEVPLLRGNIHEYKTEFDLAVNEYKKALAECDEEEIKSEIYIHLAFINQQCGDFEASLEHYKKVLKTSSKNEEALYGITYCYDILDKKEDCISFLNTFIDENPYSYVAWYNLGIAYSLINMYEKAVEAFDYAVIIKEDYAIAYYSKGDALSNLELFSDAIEVYLKALEYGMPKSEVHCAIGECYEYLEKYDEAREHYKKAVKIDPLMAEAWYGIGITLDQEERYFEALHFFEKAVDLDKENADYWFALGEAAENSGKLDLAISALEKATELNAFDTEAWLKLGNIFLEQNMSEDAIDVFSYAVSNIPDNANLRYKLCIAYFMQGNTNEALNQLQIALKLDPEKIQIIFEHLPELQYNTDVLYIINKYSL